MFNTTERNFIIDECYANGIITLSGQSGRFTGEPVQVNLRLLSSFPQLLKDIALLFKDIRKSSEFDLIASPSNDIPLATAIALTFDWPMVFARKFRKNYGMEKLVEGKFDKGQRVLVIDDEIRDVNESMQLIGRLEGSGLIVEKYCVLFESNSNTSAQIRAQGYSVTSMLQLNTILLRLKEVRVLGQDELERIQKFYQKKRVKSDLGIANVTDFN